MERIKIMENDLIMQIEKKFQELQKMEAYFDKHPLPKKIEEPVFPQKPSFDKRDYHFIAILYDLSFD